MIKNIIFDIGNVLADFCYEKFFLSFGFSEEMIERIIKATVKSEDWDAFDRGGVPYEEIVDNFVENDPGIEKEIRQICSDVSGLVEKREDSIPWIESLHEKGYKVYYLSNFSEKAYIDCRDSLDFIPYTDGGILSYKEVIVKPDPKIFKLLMERYGLRPEECLFIDDTERNCKAAEALGIRSIQFKDRKQVEEEMALLGI